MDLHTENPDQYAKTWFYITFASIVLYGLVVYLLIFRN
jgi:hypothetical protein